jgi:hypothetical protein
MLNHLKKLNEFQLNEDVNADLVKAKADVNAKQAQIAEEIAKQKDAADMKQKAVSIRNQARLTADARSFKRVSKCYGQKGRIGRHN